MSKVETHLFQQDIKLFKYFGTINLQTSTPNLAYRIYVPTMFLLVCLQLVSCITDSYLSLGNIDRMTDNMAISLTYVFGVYKFAMIFSIKHHIVQLIEAFERVEPSRSKRGGDSLMGVIALRWDLYARRYIRFVAFVAGTWYIQPLVQWRPVLPFPGTWYPWDWHIIPLYIFTYSCQVVTNFVMLLYVAAIDLFALKTIAFACDNFYALRRSLEHLDTSVDQKAYKSLIDCVKYHQKLLKVSEILQECLSSILMSQFVYNLTTLCFAIMALAKKDGIDGSSLNLITYLVLANVEIFVFCWFSHQLTSYSESVSEGSYYSDWVACNTKVRNALRLIMFRSSNPVNLTAAGIFPVSVDNYVSIVRTSFSYYTILKQLKGE